MWDFLGQYWNKIIDIATLLVAVMGVFVGAGLFVRHKRDIKELLYVEQERDDLRKKNAQQGVRLEKIDPERFIDEINELRAQGKFNAAAERAEQFTNAQTEAIGLAAEVLVEQRILDSGEFGAGPLEEAVRFAEIGLAARPDDVRLLELSKEAKKRHQAAIDGENFDSLPLDGMTDVDLHKLSLRLHKEGKYQLAEICARRSVPLALARTGPKSTNYAVAIDQHALTLQTLGDYQKAEPLMREVLAVTETARGKRHSDYARCLNNLAALFSATGRQDKALTLWREALAVTECARGKEHAEYAIGLNNLAASLGIAGRQDEAEQLYREAVHVSEAALGCDHSSTKIYRKNLQVFLDKQAAR